MVTALLATFFTACLCVFMAVVITAHREQVEIAERLNIFAGSKTSDPIYEDLNRPLSERVLVPIWNKLLELGRNLASPERKAAYERKLILAGQPYGLDADGIVVLKWVLLSLMLLLSIKSGSLVIMAVMGGVGYLIPDFLLNSWQKSRQEKITRSLPDLLDMLTVSVEAGLGFDAAIQKVVEKSEGPLSEEFQKTLGEIKIGKPRREALKDMAARLEVDDVSTFVGAMVQADQLGVSIANVLRVQADQVREKRKQRAEEKAQKAPIKMLIPMVFFIFPALLIVLLGPAVIQLLTTFK